MVLYALLMAFVAVQARAGNRQRGKYGPYGSIYGQAPATTEAVSDQQLCDCFNFDLVGGCGAEHSGAHVCYTYRFRAVSSHSHCQRSTDSVQLLLPARDKDLQRCGLCKSDLDDLFVESAPTSYALSSEYDDDDQSYGLTFEFDDDGIHAVCPALHHDRANVHVDSARLMSICFDGHADKVGSTQNGEIDISFDDGARTARCPVQGRLPMFCAGTTTTVSPNTTSSAMTSTTSSPETTGSTAGLICMDL